MEQEWFQVVLIVAHLSAFVQNVHVLHLYGNSLVIKEDMNIVTVKMPSSDLRRTHKEALQPDVHVHLQVAITLSACG